MLESNNKTHVLVANASRAAWYETNGLGKELNLIKEYFHPESREKRMDLVSDRPGHYQSRGTGRGAFVERADPKKNEAERFARELATDLDKAHSGNRFEELVIIAPPQFHGMLNKHCSGQVRSKVAHNIEKDYTQTPTKQLAIQLGQLPKFAWA